MFDDLFCAAALTSVGAVLAAAIWSGASELPMPAPHVLSAAQASTSKEVSAGQSTMPVYELPRVVVTGNRTHEGDMLAVDLPEPRIGRSGER